MFKNQKKLKRSILHLIAQRCPSNYDEIAKYKKIYVQADKTRKGYLEREELEQYLAPYFDSSAIAGIFKTVDVDENNRIYWSEFLAATISNHFIL